MCVRVCACVLATEIVFVISTFVRNAGSVILFNHQVIQAVTF